MPQERWDKKAQELVERYNSIYNQEHVADVAKALQDAYDQGWQEGSLVTRAYQGEM
jgi:hypothetical protein